MVTSTAEHLAHVLWSAEGIPGSAPCDGSTRKKVWQLLVAEIRTMESRLPPKESKAMTFEISCSRHGGINLSDCPCPKGDGAWLDYRGLLIEAERERDRYSALIAIDDQPDPSRPPAAPNRRATFEHNASYSGTKTVTATRNTDGSMLLSGIGYYEDDVTVPVVALAALGLVP